MTEGQEVKRQDKLALQNKTGNTSGNVKPDVTKSHSLRRHQCGVLREIHNYIQRYIKCSAAAQTPNLIPTQTIIVPYSAMESSLTECRFIPHHRRLIVSTSCSAFLHQIYTENPLKVEERNLTFFFY